MSEPGHNYWIDEWPLIVCECGRELHPDCDVSASSIHEALLRHQDDVRSERGAS